MAKHFSPTDLIELLVKKYGDKPDDYVLSVCHWETMPDYAVPAGLPKGVLKEPVATIRLTIGGLKKMLDPTYPYEE